MKILVVDDSKTVREYHSEILKRLGNSVSVAENGMEAQEKCSSERFDLLLVDINMPIMDGYSFVELLRGMAGYATTPVIMISTEAEATDRENAYKAGANLYFIKPVRPDDMSACLKVLNP